MAVVDDYIPWTEALSQTVRADQIMQRRLREDFFGSPVNEKDAKNWSYYNTEDRATREFVDTVFESVMVERFTANDAYLNFLTGNWEKSLKKYQKMEKGGLSDYEKALCRFMAKPENRSFQAMPPQCMALPAYRKFEGSTRQLGDMLLCAIPGSLVFCAVIGAINAIFSRGTVFFFGVPIWCGLIPGLVCGIFGYLAFQKQYLTLLDRRQELEFAQLSDHHTGLSKLVTAVFGIAMVLSLIFSIGLPLMGSRYYEDHAMVLHEEFCYERYEYTTLESVYYIRGRYNDYGDYIARPSYVLVFRDGKTHDLDCETGLKQQAVLVEALFGTFSVIEVESDRDLPHCQ